MSWEFELPWLFLAGYLSAWVWDEEMLDAFSDRALALVRDEGVIGLMPFALATRNAWDLFAGNRSAVPLHRRMSWSRRQFTRRSSARARPDRGSRSPRFVAARSRSRRSTRPLRVMLLRGAMACRGDGLWITMASWSTAVLCNGLGRYDKALEAAQTGAAYPPDMQVSNWALSELVEAAARCGHPEAAADALERLAEMASGCGTHWVLGVEARARALVAERPEADGLYRQAIEHFRRTQLRTELARTHLLYGEWLRRDRRRVDARDQLRQAQEMFTSIGMEAFAARAGRELLATGETARKRGDETPGRPHRPGAADRSSGARGAVESRDRRPPVHQPADRRVPPAQGLHEAGHQQPRAPGSSAAVLVSTATQTGRCGGGPGGRTGDSLMRTGE